MSEYTIKDKVAIIGSARPSIISVGNRRLPEFRLACEAIIKAAEDAGIDVRDIDGISGYADDRNEASHLATALGLKHLGSREWSGGGGGGGGSGAVGNAAAAVAAGYSKYAWCFRALAQGQFGRFGQAPVTNYVSGGPAYTAPYGLLRPGAMGGFTDTAASCISTALTRSRWRRRDGGITTMRNSIHVRSCMGVR